MFNWLKKMLGYRIEFTAEEARRISEQGDWKDVLFPKIKEAARGGMHRIQLDYVMSKIVDNHVEELNKLGFHKDERYIVIGETPAGDNLVQQHSAYVPFLTWVKDDNE